MFAPSINVDLEKLQQAADEAPPEEQKARPRNTRRKEKRAAETKKD